jgi:hypothetical protein
VVHVGVDATCKDGGAVRPLSVHRCGEVFIWVHPSGLVLREGADVAPKDPTGDARGTRAVTVS